MSGKTEGAFFPIETGMGSIRKRSTPHDSYYNYKAAFPPDREKIMGMIRFLADQKTTDQIRRHSIYIKAPNKSGRQEVRLEMNVYFPIDAAIEERAVKLECIIRIAKAIEGRFLQPCGLRK